MWQFLESKIRWFNFDGAEISGNFWKSFGVNFWEAKLDVGQAKVGFVVRSRVLFVQSRVLLFQSRVLLVQSRVIEKKKKPSSNNSVMDKQNLIFGSKFTGYVRRFAILFLEQAEFLVMIERILRHLPLNITQFTLFSFKISRIRVSLLKAKHNLCHSLSNVVKSASFLLWFSTFLHLNLLLSKHHQWP